MGENNEVLNNSTIDDDKSLNALPKFLKNNLVLTSSLVGLTEFHVDEINRILNNKMQIA